VLLNNSTGVELETVEEQGEGGAVLGGEKQNNKASSHSSMRCSIGPLLVPQFSVK